MPGPGRTFIITMLMMAGNKESHSDRFIGTTDGTFQALINVSSSRD
jgi:hypothetical protein